MKKATRVLSLTMAAAMAAGVLGGCSSSAQGGTASTADTSSAASTTASSADSGNVIRVGVVCSMTGGSAIYGEGAQNAVDMAVEEINSGDSGYTVEIVNGGKVADDAKDAKQAMNAYNKVMADSPAAIVGSFFSSVTLPMATQAANDGMLLLATGATNVDVTQKGSTMYPNYPYFAVAITRTCGSGGGSYIGKQLAKAFDIDLYDRKLLRLASEDSGISEELFARADENTRKTMLYRVSERVYDGSIIPPESGNFISDENLFNYQAKVLRELLNEESYICVGRAADFVLKDKPNVLTVYIDAPYEDRIEREMKRQGIGRSQAIHYIDKLDHYRESYYKYHTGRQWKRVENYDLCLDSAAVGLDNCVEVIKKVIELKFGAKCPR